jgi:pimeloyl-ACP methyl ester carboxylesterase
MPLVILHGLFGASDNWHTMGRRLGERFEVLALDQRNHGQSPHSPEMDYPIMARDVAEFIQGRGIRRAHVLGHSMGGKTAMELALAFPELVEKLVVVDMAPRAYSPHHGEIFSGLLGLDLAAYQTRAEVEAALAPTIADKAVRQFLLKNLTRGAAGSFQWKLNLKDICANYGRLSEALAPGRAFERPALFIRGGASRYVRDEDERMIRELFPQAEIKTIAGAGHWIHAEAPEEFLRLVSEFL